MAAPSWRLGLILAVAPLAACSSLGVTKVSRGETLSIPVSLGNPPDSGDTINKMWVSFGGPAYFEFQPSSSVVGPKSVAIGENWAAVGAFAISSTAPLGCNAVAYSINTSTDEVTWPNYNDDPPFPVRLSVRPAHETFVHRIVAAVGDLACSWKAVKPLAHWRWSEPRPNERIPPAPPVLRDIPLKVDDFAKGAIPRGNFGFRLGQTLASADANAKTRQLRSVPNTNVSVRPDQWRYYQVDRDPEVSAITMFLMDGTANEISVLYEARSDRPSFETLRGRLRKLLGQEVNSDEAHDAAYWADCATVVVLRGRSIQYHDLRPGTAIRFGTVGAGWAGSFSSCRPGQ